MYRRLIQFLSLSAVCTLSAAAQTHAVHKYEGVTRAVAVYEFTGDMQKPTQSRVIPVSLFIYGHFEDAAVYLANPLPMALDTGVRYYVQAAGVKKGNLDILYGRHLDPVNGVNTHYDEGWFGYGRFSLPQPPRVKKPLKITLDDDKPRLAKNNDEDARPDPDRPTFEKEKVETGKQKKDKDVASVTPVSTPDAGDDDDRPVFRRHDSAQPPKAGTPEVSQSNRGVLEDPDRPVIHRGRPENTIAGVDVEHLKGLPPNVSQMVAVSDPVDRPEHDFMYHPDAEEQAEVMAGMEKMARDVLANPALAAQMANPTATPDNSLLKLARLGETPSVSGATTTTKASAKTTRTVAGRRAASRSKAKPVAAPVVALQQEQLKSYDLAYNSTPTYVFSAQTAGDGAAEKYVTVVAQKDSFGVLQPILRSLTDAAHLDNAPQLRLVDAVDADASNRAMLLFELRNARSRAFALYRIYGGQPTQVFVTGNTQ